jgi:hypothetical protein
LRKDTLAELLMDPSLTPKVALVITAVISQILSLLFFLLAKRDEEPSLDTPLISVPGKKIIGGSLLFGSIACFSTLLLHPKL